jgi:SAM-dependent methyltransferase
MRRGKKQDLHIEEIRMTAMHRFSALAASLLISASACAQPAAAPAAASEEYKPSVFQPGKDVVWVPTSQTLAERMLDLAKVTSNDYVIDLGSGDGRTVITAAKRGARALGIEYNPDLVELSKRSAQREGVVGRAEFVKADLFESDFSGATVITMFLLPDINLKLRPKLLELKPGTRIVSNSFTMGEWEADETITIDNTTGCENSWCTALLWIVPARVQGTHKVKQGELTLKQEFQKLTGTLKSGGKAIPVEGKVLGDQVLLRAGGREMRGRVNGKGVELL